MRKTTAAAAALTVLFTFTTACSSSGGDETSDTTAAKSTTTNDRAEGTTTTKEETTTTEKSSGDTVPVDEWADDFCGSFGTWIDEIKNASGDLSGSVSAGDLEGARTAIVGLFETASEETQTLITALEDGGTPDIEDGDALVEDLIGKFQDFDDAITAAKSDAENLPVDDPTTFQSEVTTLITTFQTETTDVGNSFSELDAKYPSQELNDALSSSCNF